MSKVLCPPDEFDTSDQYTTLAWKFTEHRDGEIATFETCGLSVRVDDLDGDRSEWRVHKGRGGPILASGQLCFGNHFFTCLRDAEAALRKVITDRIAELKALRAVREGGRT